MSQERGADRFLSVQLLCGYNVFHINKTSKKSMAVKARIFDYRNTEHKHVHFKYNFIEHVRTVLQTLKEIILYLTNLGL